MPSVLQLRVEQPGVVGVTATVWRIEDGKLRQERLVNDRKVSEESRVLKPDELARVRAALSQADLATLPPAASRSLEANAGKLVLEADGRRWEAPYGAGAPQPDASAGSTEARLREVADVVRGLSQGGR